MAQRKFYGIKLSEYESEALFLAAERWPEHAGNTSELLRQILADWKRIKLDEKEGGTRTQTLQRLSAIEAMLRRLLDTLEPGK